MDSLETVRTCCEWQISNLNVEGRAKKLKEELEKIGLAQIWQSQVESNANKICKIITESFNDIERQCIFDHKRKNVLGILLRNETRVG
jgi:hypothetical protein